jgi:hypothetical protein
MAKGAVSGWTFGSRSRVILVNEVFELIFRHHGVKHLPGVVRGVYSYGGIHRTGNPAAGHLPEAILANPYGAAVQVGDCLSDGLAGVISECLLARAPRFLRSTTNLLYIHAPSIPTQRQMSIPKQQIYTISENLIPLRVNISDSPDRSASLSASMLCCFARTARCIPFSMVLSAKRKR